ncbi:MAG: hypothetical protein MJ025_01100 [Victivallaceae bacterium]|nr:hypothetical protein [Victivallaceae bacterium]
MRRLLAVLAVSIISLAASAIGPVVVSKSVKDNPTISCKTTGDANIDREVKRFLSICGWFDLTSGKSDYVLNINVSGGSVKAELAMGGAPAGAWNFKAGTDAREIAKLIVDTVIEKTFRDLKVQGFCRSRIAFCAQTSPSVRNIYACDIDGNNMTQLTHFNTLCVEPCWTPNATSICYSKYGRTGIDVIETTVTPPQRSRVLSGFRGLNSGVSVSPNGKEMAIILSFDRRVDFFLIEIATGRRRRVTNNISVEASPCWNKDGSKLAFVSDETGSPRIVICNRDGSGKLRLPTVGRDAVTPDWSGDDRIVYAAKVDGRYVLAVLDMKSGKNEIITKEDGSWESPGWAADNRQIVCKCTRGGRSALYVVDSRTGHSRQLISTQYPLSMPSWSPCKSK